MPLGPVQIPDNFSDEQVATIPVASLAALVGLFHASGAGIPHPFAGEKAGKGKPIVVLGGSSSVGQYVIQFARLAGFSAILTTSSAAHESYLKSLGATHVFPRDVSASTLSELAPSLSVVYDAISSPETQSFGLELLASNPDGKLVTVLGPNPESEKTRAIYGSSHTFRDVSVPFWGAVKGLLESGELKPNRFETLQGLENIEEALEQNRKGVSGVKVVVRF